MSRPEPRDPIVAALEQLIRDIKKPAIAALIARLRAHQHKYAMEDGGLYWDLDEAIEILKGGPDA
jgi:hypothetical protein